MIKRISFSWYYVYKVLYLFIEPSNLSFSTISGWGIALHYCDIEWFALERNRDRSVILETASKYCILDSSVDLRDTPLLLRDSYSGWLAKALQVPRNVGR